MSDQAAFQRPGFERLEHALRRDGGRCVWCGRGLRAGDGEATLEHVVPRLKGGPAWPENEVAACRSCNHARGHKGPVDWLKLCEGRGWSPSRELIYERLRRLAAAIADRGGQRRARPYLAGQLRRFEKWLGGKRD